MLPQALVLVCNVLYESRQHPASLQAGLSFSVCTPDRAGAEALGLLPAGERMSRSLVLAAEDGGGGWAELYLVEPL